MKNIFHISLNPLASPSAGAPALKYGDINTEATSPGEVKRLISLFTFYFILIIVKFTMLFLLNIC